MLNAQFNVQCEWRAYGTFGRKDGESTTPLLLMLLHAVAFCWFPSGHERERAPNEDEDGAAAKSFCREMH